MNNVIIQYATHNHMLKCVCENEGLRILVKWVYEAESSDNNARVCKPEYFKKYYDRPW